MADKSDSPIAEWSTVRRTLVFLAAITLLSAVVTFLRWPTDTGNAHWSEWLVFYGFPPFAYAFIFAAILYTVQKWRVSRGEREQVRLPLVGIWVAVLIFTGIGTVGALLRGL